MKQISFWSTLILLFFTCTLQAQISEELTNACLKGDLAAAKKAVENGADINAVRPTGTPVLADAMFWPEIVQYLIDKGADPNGGTYSALTIAANNYAYETMEVLLKNGADPSRGQVSQKLHPIAQMINTEKAKKKPNKKLIKTWEEQLTAAGATMTPTETNISPLENTINQTNCVRCVELLLQYKADPNQRDQVGNDMITNSLLRDSDLGENFTSYAGVLENQYGMTLPSWFKSRVLEGSATEEIEALIEAGADLNYVNPVNGNTPLMAALGSKNSTIAKMMIEKGADVNFITPDKKDALSIAVETGDLDLVQVIVGKGADVNRETWGLDQKSGQYAKGFTPLTIAVVHDHVEVAKYLIDEGSKPKEGVSGYHINPKNGCPYKLKNKTAIYYAIENENQVMIEMLTNNYNSWNMHQMEMKQPDNSNEIDLGAVTVTITSCWKIKGVFTPSVYAKKLGNKDISSYLKSKGL